MMIASLAGPLGEAPRQFRTAAIQPVREPVQAPVQKTAQEPAQERPLSIAA
jgi:hypothetical protein